MFVDDYYIHLNHDHDVDNYLLNRFDFESYSIINCYLDRDDCIFHCLDHAEMNCYYNDLDHGVDNHHHSVFGCPLHIDDHLRYQNIDRLIRDLTSFTYHCILVCDDNQVHVLIDLNHIHLHAI